jgi:chromosome segregation ATPase
MVKKSMCVGGAAVLLLVLLFGGDAWSYLRQGVKNTQAAVTDNIPIEFQLERARTMIKDLDPEIARNMRIIAKEEVEIAGLKEELGSLEAKLAKSEQQVLRLTNDLKRGDSHFVYAGKSYTSDQVKTDLENRFNRHKALKNTVDSLTKVVSKREQGLAAAQEKLVAMQAAKGQLEADVAELAARYKMVEVAQASSTFKFDNSVLSRCQETVKDIGSRIKVAENLVNADTAPAGEIDLEDKTTTDITEEVTKFFGGADENIVKLD